MKTLFSTAGAHPRRSFKIWNETIFERIVPVELKQMGDRPFNGTLEAADVGPLLITRITQSAIRTEATPNTIRRHAKHDTITVGIVQSGIVTSTQGGREAVQKAGEIVILDRKPTVMSTIFDSRCLILEIPRAPLEKILGPASIYSALTIGAAQPSSSLVSSFFEELVRVHAQLSAETATRMASIGIDLLAASIAERIAQDTPITLHATLTLQRAKSYIEINLCNTNLDVPQIAAAVGVSVRRLQEMFQQHGRCISEWIWQRRLEVAFARLSDPNCAHLSIGRIAHGCGFTSQPHFSRRFRDRYNLTPSECRNAAYRKIS